MDRSPPAYGIGMDFGTSGARLIAIDIQGEILAEVTRQWSSTESVNPFVWQATLFELIGALSQDLRSHLTHITINGTSSTVLLCDEIGQPLCPPMMYNDMGDRTLVRDLTAIVPTGHCVLSATSSLVKLLTFHQQPEWTNAKFFLHQADWLSFLLHGKLGVSDYHNSLKLGYDPAQETYPDWFQHPWFAPVRSHLPHVLPPGSRIGPVIPDLAQRLDLPPNCQICAGTTDSIAAFLASGTSEPGDAVTSLGSTLVLKLLSHQRVDHSEYGIYSHRLGPMWLVGGASNTGGAILTHYFSTTELTQLSALIDPRQDSGLDYYPLLKPGERFPINDPDLTPCLEPRPEDPVAFLHGLLESLARIEAQGYALLHQCGAPAIKRVLSAGGGAKNEAWRHLRQRYLQVPVEKSPQEQAAYGTATLGLYGAPNPTQGIKN